jgi:tRNA (guanine-N7-)-methyltransferase
MVTDDAPYSEWIIDVMQKDGRWESCHPEPYYATEKPGYGTSFFEDLWRSKGLKIRYHEFKKASQ